MLQHPLHLLPDVQASMSGLFIMLLFFLCFINNFSWSLPQSILEFFFGTTSRTQYPRSRGLLLCFGGPPSWSITASSGNKPWATINLSSFVNWLYPVFLWNVWQEKASFQRIRQSCSGESFNRKVQLGFLRSESNSWSEWKLMWSLQSVSRYLCNTIC
jgi:hypothetical protein